MHLDVLKSEHGVSVSPGDLGGVHRCGSGGGQVASIIEKHRSKHGIFPNHLVERVHFHDIEGNIGGKEGRDTAVTAFLDGLLGVHVVVGSQIDHVPDL